MLSAFEQLLGGYAADAAAGPIALVVGTSGSTGTPKRTALTARALAASAAATERFFDSNSDAASQWLLALPAHYIAGAQVLARSVLAGTAPVIARSVIEPVHFSPEVFLQAVERMSSARRFISLVPTQLHKLLESADTDPHLGAEIHETLSSFTGILLGGAPASADLLAAATALGLNTVTTYGSAETAGGCVYSGSVLPGVRVELVPEEGMPAVPDTGGKPAQVGRIWISGAHLASGYIGDAARTAARQAAIGQEDYAGAAQRVAGGVSLGVEQGELTCVTAARPVPGPLGGLGLTARARACTYTEPSSP